MVVGCKGYISQKNPRGQGSDSISEVVMKLSRKHLSGDVVQVTGEQEEAVFLVHREQGEAC